jgi:hypothetical protein
MTDWYRRSGDVSDLRDPQWGHAAYVHDWRNHVGERTQALWHTFTDEQRLAIAADAEDEASAEEWE